jgi:asparagine synthase
MSVEPVSSIPPADQCSQTWCPALNPSGLTELEVAAGVVLGQGTGPRFDLHATTDPLAALRELARALLATPPCVVAFSGGRDSSALLAVLVDVARREGLDEPIAVTARWDEDDASNESDWQEEVARAIGVTHWEIIKPGTDLDLLGDESTAVLSDLGLTWPAPAYALRPIVRMATGGVLVTGEGGDEAFGLWPYGRLWSSVRHHHMPRQFDLRALALGSLPPSLRRRRLRSSQPPYQDWLRPEAFRLEAEAQAGDQSDEPLRWDRYQVVSRRRRSMDLAVHTFERLCKLEGARFVAPFVDESFLSSLAAWGGALGRGDRTEVMTALFSGVLPGPWLSRTSKATFGGIFWGPASRKFAEEWDGSGLSEDIVDVDALRRAWLASVPVFGSALPLHAAWLFDHRMQLSRASNP